MRLPIRARIAFFGAGVVAVTVVMFAVVVYVLSKNNLETDQDKILERRGQQIWRIMTAGPNFQRGRITGPFSPFSNDSPDTFIVVLQANGSAIPELSTPVVNTGEPVPVPESLLKGLTTNRGVFAIYEPAPGTRVRVYLRAWSRPDLGAKGYVAAGRSLAVLDQQLAGLRWFLAVGALLSLVGAAAASWLVAGRALRPLEVMAKTAEQIGSTQDLSRRLPEEDTRDEVGRLQKSFNGMLQQLEDAYKRLQSALVAQRRFVADASHELRTPLTTIRGNVGLLLQRADITADDRGAALQDIAGESERMSRMVQDLLTLARADAGQHLDRTLLEMQPLVQEVARQAQTLQPARDIQLDNGTQAAVLGNSDALRQLLWILVDNAVKHTSSGGHVRLRLSADNGHAELSVVDDGRGIPPGDLERIFERFYQADPARSGEGTGLGLAIAQWIAKEHDGRLTADNNQERGATFRVEIPLAKS
jgi:heavy metal sensor kinase